MHKTSGCGCWQREVTGRREWRKKYRSEKENYEQDVLMAGIVVTVKRLRSEMEWRRRRRRRRRRKKKKKKRRRKVFREMEISGE